MNSASAIARKGKKLFYGWWMVGMGSLATAYNSMINVYGTSTFFLPLVNQFGWSRAQLSGAISLSRLESGLLGGIEGFLVDRFGPRKIMLIGIFIKTAGYIMLSRLNSLFQFYAYYIFMVAVGGSLSYGLPVDVAIANWFIKRRGTAFGLLRAGMGVGAAGVPLMAWFIYRYGWRPAFLFAGIGAFAIGLPLALIMRHRPEPYGYLPDGRKAETEQATPSVSPTATPQSAGAPAGLSPWQALKVASFWLISLAFGIRLMVTGAVTLHQIPFLVDLGYSPAVAASVLGSMGVSSIIGRIGLSALSDIIGTKRVVAISFFFLAASLFILANARETWQVILFVAIYGPSYGGLAAIMPAMQADYFGRRAFGSIRGLAGIAQTGGSMAGPVFAGYMFDATGSYRLAFIIFGILLFLAMGMILALKRAPYH